ncbi:type II toxin-antitoxin system RatA family toxin [Alteromonas oceanisediminis]|uniref:type II toxin-antitoxin system RatA family toxin n=1 Tax=Alteromonas oceanisediminis TaxID=2836180 RepID=UPI001BD9FBD6|nr:type II toxin-antitoxin system RatA family toxin [Alteromonas oceanisediminis]MBT0586592.1 type II toxin-antitoxin system RatA family toxin [Alteromonas oceanisediminis]
MAQVQRSALVAFSAASMFDLVNDVESYPEFLPGCADSRIDQHSDDAMQASLLISKAGIKQWFTTRNHWVKNQRIDMSLVDGPFSALSGGWVFTPLNESACKIELNLQFEFNSRLTQLAFGKVFNSIAANMVDAFTARAKQVYSHG